MRRLPVAAFVALAIATIAAFFVTQHLKVTTPLLAGLSGAGTRRPSTRSNGQVCRSRGRDGELKPVSHRRMFVSFYLLNRSDDVDVYIVNNDGDDRQDARLGRPHAGRRHPVRTDVHLERADRQTARSRPTGTTTSGSSLIHQGRSVLISNNSGAEPVTVETVPPRPRVTSVTPGVISQPARHGAVTIHYTGTNGLDAGS